MLVRKIVNFAKKETVLFAAVLLAFGSMVCVPPDMQYLSYIDYRVLASCIGIKAFCKEKYLPLEADFGLLLTFVAFFIFIGNMGRICVVREVLSQVLNGRELLISFLCSQMISNVPAAILLSGFTQEYRGLLQGVNIGGLGTLIASLASLISYKFFAAESEQTPAAGTRGRYMITFTIWNVGMSLVLLAAAFLVK